ncbi:hypothetical protein Q9L58_001550 [Maublancomyces gigas]|uniref:rRNA methyltransferase 1, mitochondrial n=1 Tax=Discina gigas TaxID=1032678 RepID=A0ABR3GTS6_9PEZI
MSIRPLLSAFLKRSPSSFSPSLLSRSASTNSAINRGLRRSPTTKERPDAEKRSSLFDSDETDGHSPRLDSPGESENSVARYSPRSDYPKEDRYPSSSDYSNPGHSDSYPQYSTWRPFAKPNPRLDYIPPPPGADWTPKPRRHIPKVDYNSEWIYGTSVVEAALKAKKRKMYKLYIHTSGNRTPENKLRDRAMSGLAVDAGLEVVEERDGGLLDSMSNSRPHNGYVLECLPLPKTPILSLGAVAPNKTSFSIQLAQHHHTTGEPIEPDDFPGSITCRDPKRRYPFVLMLDEILDPGNLGAILRSAYYLGVDAVTLSSRNCAPISPVCLKAAAGAAELMPILEQSRSDKLITSSIENGWTFYAAIPPPTKQQAKRDRYVFSLDVGKAVREGPVVLILGSEGDGLRPFLKKHVQYCVSLDKGPGTDALVDSLNVSVASALLCASFLKGT